MVAATPFGGAEVRENDLGFDIAMRRPPPSATPGDLPNALKGGHPSKSLTQKPVPSSSGAVRRLLEHPLRQAQGRLSRLLRAAKGASG